MMKVSDKSGIYRIVIRSSNIDRIYIGQAKNLRRRRKDHLVDLRSGSHKNQRMQRAFVKYGEGSFSFEVILVAAPDRDLLAYYEKKVLDLAIAEYGSDSVLNVQRDDMMSHLGLKRSDETKKKQSLAMRGRPRTPAQIEAVRRSNKMRTVSQETRDKMSLAATGNKNAKGWRQSDAHKAKVAAFFIGRKRNPEDLKKSWITRRLNKESIDGIVGD